MIVYLQLREVDAIDDPDTNTKQLSLRVRRHLYNYLVICWNNVVNTKCDMIMIVCGW